jgi:hypothetical protein
MQTTIDPNSSREDLLRRAALAGPGYRGNRSEISGAERLRIATEFHKQGESPPEYLLHEVEWIDRSAKLFEAGIYPDKRVTVTQIELQQMVDHFDLPIPVLIEHAESPLQIGFVTEIHLEGSELFGNIALTKEADALMIQCGASSLSVGLERDLSRIREVSLVRFPRVESARIFHLAPMFQAEFIDFDYQSAIAERQKCLAFERADRKVEKWINEGKIQPALRECVRTLLACDAFTEVGSVSEVFSKFIESLSRSNPFAELAPTDWTSVNREESSRHLLLPEEAAFYRKHFPGLDLRTIAEGKVL